MRERFTVLMLALVVALATGLVAGCREQAQETPAADEQAVQPPTGEQEPAGETAGQAEDAHTETPAAPPTPPEQLQIEVDYDRAYSPQDLERLRGVLISGTAEAKAKAKDILVDLLLHSRVASVRGQAALILAIAPEGVEEALAQVARSDPEGAVRATAVESLASAPMSDKLMALLADLQNSDDAAVRAAALSAEMDTRLTNPQKYVTVDWLARMLGRRKDDATAQLQMKLVGKGAVVLPPVIDCLRTASSPIARSAAACTIGMICAGTSPRQQEFARMARDLSHEAIPAAEPANLTGLKPLEAALRDPVPEVRAIAAQCLGYLGQESSAPLLGRALHDANEEVRWWAALALQTVPNDVAFEDMAHAATKDPSARVREAAVRALGWVKGERVIRPLIRATADEASAVRQAAATELGRFDTQLSLDALTRLFHDENEDVRWSAVLAVGNLRKREAAPALIEAMRDPSPMVSTAAERALQRMGIGEQRFGTRGEME